ncbi:hypothetical protein EPUL_002505 [Erysiphe pulchra]|uniref:Wax synthase domain-containing protein n=1 Tax=Erysiphe pulchra TaxID=225359 RepID=A0A2S4PUI3_9PEZI|nr:hypothetical protein EPUL_002505 [Erysiphe pulchra]
MASHFPYSTSTGPAPTVSEIYSKYRQVSLQQFSDGIRRPFIFPYDFLSIFIGIAYFCIPHKESPVIYAGRWPLVGLITWFELRKFRETVGTGPDLGVASGMISAFIIIWSWTWLIFKKPQLDAKRVERRQVKVTREVKKLQQSEKSTLSGEKVGHDTAPLSKADSCEVQIETKEIYKYFWQPYPDNFKERFFWVMDLVFNARGPGWNWAIPNIPLLTPEIICNLENSALEIPHSKISPPLEKSFKSRHEHLLCQITVLLFSYLAFDALTTFMINDPYFKFGPTTYDLPLYLQQLHPSVLQFYRLLITSVTIGIGISMSWSQNHILFCHILGPKILGLRGESWYYPNVWGGFSDILQKGLGGLWGSFWHQTFRNCFTAPTKYLIQKGFFKPGSLVAKISGLFFAFGLSGFLHSASSITSVNTTKPLDQTLFFGLQGVGIALQDFLCKIFSPVIVKLPKSFRQTGNLLFTLIWLYFTGSKAADDFARSGAWLVKPIPFSLVQSLGFGEHITGWDFWNSYKFMWYTGNYWWESGIVLT